MFVWRGKCPFAGFADRTPAAERDWTEPVQPAPTLTNELSAPIYAVHRVEAGYSVMVMMSGPKRLRPLPQASGEARLERMPVDVDQ